MILLLVAALLDPAALWHDARTALDARGDRVAAHAALTRLVSDHPDAPDAERARRTLAWLAGAHPGRLQVLDDDARRAWLRANPTASNAPVVACHLAAGMDEGGAHALLAPYRNHASWGWLVEREWNRRARFDRWLRSRRLRLLWLGLAAFAALLAAAFLLWRFRRVA